MVRFTLQIPTELNASLIKHARLNHRSKNKHIIHLLELALRAAAHPRYQLGVAQMCHNGLHLFAAGEVTTKDFCNCGMYVLGELQ